MKLTVFTPAYNRADTLVRLYESLKAQTCRDFEWLIVDDGSTDATRQVAAGFHADFPVHYYYKENGGKHTAYNLGLTLAQGELFYCVDSDDLLPPDGVAAILEAAASLPPRHGIVAYKQDTQGKRLSGEFPAGLGAVRFSDLSLRYGCGGEFSLIFPTEVAKEFPFPVFEGERFVTESVVYDRIEQVCPLIPLPRVVMLCEYQADGYSQNANAVMARNPAGYCLYFMQRIDRMPSFKAKLVCAGKYWCFRWISKNRKLVYIGKHRMLSWLGIPVGLLFRVYYKCVRGF